VNSSGGSLSTANTVETVPLDRFPCEGHLVIDDFKHWHEWRLRQKEANNNMANRHKRKRMKDGECTKEERDKIKMGRGKLASANSTREKREGAGESEGIIRIGPISDRGGAPQFAKNRGRDQ